MAFIAPETLSRVREVLNSCGPFASNRELWAVFVDERIAPWRDDLPEADSRIDRIDALIEYLYDNFSVNTSDEEGADPQNALVLFIHVLIDRTAPEDACCDTLQSVAAKLAEEIALAEIKARDIVTASVPSVAAVTDAALLDNLISNQLTAIRQYRGFAVGLVILGLIVSMLGFALPAVLIQAAFKPWISMGGLFIASLSIMQFKEILDRKDKVGLFTTMKGQLAGMRYDPDYNLLCERIDRLIWQMIEHEAVD
jgi:hypothetical protein